MLTINGKNHIRRYLAQYVPNIAAAMAFGIGTRTAVGGDFALQFETLRAEINSIVYDFANNKLIYKATIPADFGGTINEVGLYTLFEDPKANGAGTKVLTNINDGEGWTLSASTTPSTFTTTGALIGTNGLSQAPIASANRLDSLSNISLDLSGYSGADFISVAVNIGNGNTSAAAVRFKTDASNYYSFALPSVTAGYKIVDFLKSAASVTGSPDWSNITTIEFSTTSGAGTSAVTWDGIALLDTDTANLDYTLVARKVLVSPIVVPSGQSQEVEFSVDVSL